MIATTIVAFLRRDWAVARSYRANFLLRLIQPLLSLTLLFFLGRLVSGHKLLNQSGLRGGYFQFAVVGWALLLVFGVGIYSYTEKVREEQTSGTIEALLATPNRASLLIFASSVYDLIQSLVEALVLVVFGMLLFGLRLHVSAVGAFGAVLGILPGVVLAASLGIFLSGLTLVLKKAGPLVSLAGGALPLLGGVYYPVTVFPAPLRFLAEALPFTWAINVVREALLNGTLSWGLIALLIVTSVLAIPIAGSAFTAALAHARKTGTLGHY